MTIYLCATGGDSIITTSTTIHYVKVEAEALSIWRKVGLADSSTHIW